MRDGTNMSNMEQNTQVIYAINSRTRWIIFWKYWHVNPDREQINEVDGYTDGAAMASTTLLNIF